MARDNEPGAACLLGGGGTRKQQSLELHPFLHPEPRSSQAHPRQGGVCWVSFWKGIVAPLPRPGLARAGRAAPNNSRESRNGVCWFHLLSWDTAGASSTRGWLGWSHPSCSQALLEPGRGGSRSLLPVTSWPGSCCSALGFYSHKHSLNPCWAES